MNAICLLLAEMGSIEKTVITIFAVAGGFLFGFLGAGGLARLFANGKLSGEPPGKLARFTKVLGGAGGALAMYYLISGEGGLGLGGKGGGAPVSLYDGKDEPKAIEEQRKAAPKEIEKKQKNSDEELRGKPLHVYILGADSPNGRYFRFEDDPQPLTDQEVVDRIEQLEKNGKIKNKYINLERGVENYSVPQYSKIDSKLNAVFGPRGYRIVPFSDSPAGKD